MNSIVQFRLTGFTVSLTHAELTLGPNIVTDPAAGTRTIALPPLLADAPFDPAELLSQRDRFSPEMLNLHSDLPAARVMPQAKAAALALVDLLNHLAKDEAQYDSDAAFSEAARSWHSGLEAAVQPMVICGDDSALRSAENTPVTSPTNSTDSTDSTGSDDSAVGLFNASAVEEFIAFDVETANKNFGSVIQFGLARVKDGEVVDKQSWLCQPPSGLEEFEDETIAIHGITPEDVADQPTFAERVAEFTEYVGDTPMVAHWAKFDFTNLGAGCRAADIATPEVNFSCTYMFSRQAQLGLANLKLPTLAQEAGFEFTNHHDAAADAEACAHVAMWLMRSRGAHSLKELSAKLSLSIGHLEAKKISNVRYEATATDLGASGAASANSGSEASGSGASGSFSAGGSGTNNSARSNFRRRNAKWDAAKTPSTIPEPNPEADPNGLLFGQRVTLTGDFAPFDKGYLWDKIAEAGANINKGVTKKTTILVAGPWDNVTSKEKKARQLQEEGQEIEIWSATDLYNALSLDPDDFDPDAV